MQRVDKTIYKEFPDNILENGETFQKPDYIGQSSNKLTAMFTNDELLFIFSFTNNSSIEYHQKLKYPALSRRIERDFNTPLSMYFHENTLFMLHPDRKISIIQFLKQGSNKDYIYNTPQNYFPSKDFLSAQYIIGWNEYITIFTPSKLLIIDRFSSGKTAKSLPLSPYPINNYCPDASFGFGSNVVVVNNEPTNPLFNHHSTTNGVLITSAPIPPQYKNQLHKSVAHNDKDLAVAYTHHVYLYSLSPYNTTNTSTISPYAVINYPHAAISKITLDNTFLVIGDMVGGASVYTSTGSPIAHIPPEEEFVTGKKQHKKRVVAILRFHIFVIVGLADGRAKFFSWADRDSLGRTRVIDKKDCGGKIVRICAHPELSRIVIVSENGSERRLIGLTYWNPVLKASNDVSPVLAYSPELRYVSYTKPFVDTLRAFLSVEHSGQSVGFKRTIPRLRGIANFVKFLEEADIDHKMPFPVEMVHNLTKAMSDYMQLKLDEVGYDVQIRMEHNVRNAISLLCSIDTATIPLVLTPGFPTDTYLNEFPTHSKMILDQKMYRPNPSLDDDKHPKNFLWSLLKKLYNDYIDISNALENIDVFMSSVGKDNPLANASIVKIYGRYVQILQDIKETAWMISQIIGLKEKDRWYYGGGLYMGKKMPDFSSENPNVPRIEYPLTLN